MTQPKGMQHRRIAYVERQRHALGLRKRGMTYEAIAEALGLPGGRGAAYHLISKALRETLQEPAEEVRRIELDRLDKMHERLWPRAIAGHLPSVDRVLKIMRRRAALLGLDAPQRAPPDVWLLHRFSEGG